MVKCIVARVLARSGRSRLSGTILAPLIGLISACGPLASSVQAQVGQETMPSLTYHVAFSDFYDGEYKDALDGFLMGGRGAIKIGMTRWIDSICYETMIGECYYQMGHLSKALEHYTTALKLYLAYSDWLRLVQFPPTILVSPTRKRIPWGASSRGSQLGQYPSEMPIAQGRINQKQVFQRGGVVQPAHFRLIQVHEIIRCTTLAIRRRTQLLGPVRGQDPVFAELIAALSRRPGRPNHWSEAWIDLQLGLAYVAGGREGQAEPLLKRAILAAGRFDHPLTSIALLELGRLSLIGGNYPAAAEYFEEATYAAVHDLDPGVLEEAFRGGALAHLLANRKGVYPPVAAIGWAKVKDLRQLRASLLLSAAENYAVLGQTREAAGLLEDARLAIGRRQMGAGRIGSRLNFLKALTLFQQKRIAEGDAALDAAMDFMQRGSHWLFQITLADGLYTSGAVSPRGAMDLYRTVLRDPQPADWASDPMESLAVLVTPHPLPIEHWFEVAWQRREYETALEIADRARRHRFFSSLAFGGRLQSLRWILEGPVEMLDQQAELLRQDLLARYPGYERLAERGQAVRARLDGMPLVAEDAEVFRQQGQELAQLASVSAQQEAILREMAARREPAGLVFPPLRTTQDIQKSLPTGHALLVFFATSRQLYAFLLDSRRYTYWEVRSPAMLFKQIGGLLREMGHFQANHALGLKDLTDNQWQESAGQVLQLILEGSQADFSQKFDELVIVPDGVLWYLPFEALRVEVDGESRPLIARFRIRYAPTASLATSNGPARSPTGNTAVVVGQLFPRDDDSVARAAFEQLAGVVPGAVALKSPLPAPSAVYGTMFDRLIVLDDMEFAGQGQFAGQGPYGFAPVPIDRGKPGSSLQRWMWLPWGGPDEIILPGYHTAAENSLNGLNRTPFPGRGAGNELFLSVCGLMSSGTRTLLLSRWRTGGQTSFDLVREFAQELPHTSPADAWRRSVFLAAGSRLNLEAEPRIKRTAPVALPPRADHPFFWAGYMLIDPGTVAHKPDPEPDEPDPEDPVLKFNKPDQPAAKKP